MDSTTSPTVRLYVRADADVVDRRDAIINRITQLDFHDLIDSYRIHAWPGAISLDLAREIDHEPITRIVNSFEQWADRTGVEIHPPFQYRTVASSITGAADDLLVLPMLCLATAVDGEVVDVAPSRDDEAVHTIADALDALAAGVDPSDGRTNRRVANRRPADRPPTPTDPST